MTVITSDYSPLTLTELEETIQCILHTGKSSRDEERQNVTNVKRGGGLTRCQLISRTLMISPHTYASFGSTVFTHTPRPVICFRISSTCGVEPSSKPNQKHPFHLVNNTPIGVKACLQRCLRLTNAFQCKNGS